MNEKSKKNKSPLGKKVQEITETGTPEINQREQQLTVVIYEIAKFFEEYKIRHDWQNGHEQLSRNAR